MWRIASCVYRAFRNTATHRCPQDVLIPLTTICSTDDDDDSKLQKEKKPSCATKYDIYQVLKNNQFSYKNIEKLQEYLKQFSIQQFTKKLNVVKQIETSKPECKVKEVPAITPPNKPEETLDSLLKTDETCINTVKNLSDLHDETMSIINLQLALEALESENFQFGIETLQNLAKNGTNAAALYNLGICYERGIGVEKNRAKACDHYRQASVLGHINAQFNLTLLSNHIDFNENDDDDDDDNDETLEQTITEKSSPSFREIFLRFTLSNDYKEDQSFNDYQFDLKNQTIACLS